MKIGPRPGVQAPPRGHSVTFPNKNYHKPSTPPRAMAKSDSFFIRAQVDTANDGSTYNQTEIDLGSFVNLGVSKSTLLRVHNIAVSYLNASSASAAINETATNSKVSWQLCTQSQTNIVYPGADKSMVSSGGLDIFADGTPHYLRWRGPRCEPSELV